MRLVALTMLQIHQVDRNEMRDAIDVRWTMFLQHCGLEPLYLPNDVNVAIGLLSRARPVGIVLTGGGSCSAISGYASSRDQVEAMALEWAEAESKPVLGVCRGMQTLLSREGASLASVSGHIACSHPVVTSQGTRVVNSYHKYGFRNVPPGYALDAISSDGVLEAASDYSRRRVCVMWHPERNINPDTADIRMFQTLFRDI